MSFPSQVLQGQSFEFIFENNPCVVEFVDSSWIREKCSGIFLEFYDFVKDKINIPPNRQNHVDRAKKFCREASKDEIPLYMSKYKE